MEGAEQSTVTDVMAAPPSTDTDGSACTAAPSVGDVPLDPEASQPGHVFATHNGALDPSRLPDLDGVMLPAELSLCATDVALETALECTLTQARDIARRIVATRLLVALPPLLSTAPLAAPGLPNGAVGHGGGQVGAPTAYINGAAPFCLSLPSSPPLPACPPLKEELFAPTPPFSDFAATDDGLLGDAASEDMLWAMGVGKTVLRLNQSRPTIVDNPLGAATGAMALHTTMPIPGAAPGALALLEDIAGVAAAVAMECATDIARHVAASTADDVVGAALRAAAAGEDIGAACTAVVANVPTATASQLLERAKAIAARIMRQRSDAAAHSPPPNGCTRLLRSHVAPPPRLSASYTARRGRMRNGATQPPGSRVRALEPQHPPTKDSAASLLLTLASPTTSTSQGGRPLQSNGRPSRKRSRHTAPEDAISESGSSWGDGASPWHGAEGDPQLAKRTRTTTNDVVGHPPWHTQLYVMLKALAECSGPAGRKEICQRALAVDAKVASEYRCPVAFRGKTPHNSASSILTKFPEHLISSEDARGRRLFELAFRFNDFDDAREKYEAWKVKLREEHWPSQWRTWNEQRQAARPEEVVASIEPPKDEADLVEVKGSNLLDAGRGVFSLVDIPALTTLGFYFGVPCFEDEYDKQKDHVGRSSEYSIKYRSTVLDATDANGQPYEDPILCPFHMLNDHPWLYNVALVDGPVVNQILVTTARDIQKGEELYANYGTQIDRKGWKYRMVNPEDGKIRVYSHRYAKGYYIEGEEDPDDPALLRRRCTDTDDPTT